MKIASKQESLVPKRTMASIFLLTHPNFFGEYTKCDGECSLTVDEVDEDSEK